MNMLGNTISTQRKKLGLTQEQLAQRLDVTNQAVSKWETDQSCPDVAMLPRLAELFGISMDELFGREPAVQQAVQDLPWEDDDVFHMVLYRGRTLLRHSEEAKRFIIRYEGPARDVHCEIGLECGNIEGSVTAGSYVECNDVGGNVNAGSYVECDNVGGYVLSGDYIECSDVGKYVNAGSYVECGTVGGSVSAGGYVECTFVGGNISAGGYVECHGEQARGNSGTPGSGCDNCAGSCDSCGCSGMGCGGMHKNK